MRFSNFFRKSLFLSLFFTVLVFASFGQKLPEPRQERLLNGLKVLMWPDQKAEKVWVKIRIHSGSAFDPQGKEGVMRLLADSFFPNETAQEFFTEDLGGSLQVIATYDYIQINGSSKPNQFLTMLETLATAISNPTIDKETTTKVRAALLEKVKEFEADPAYVADRAVAERLFGSFPYGRPLYGTPGSLATIDFADLIQAKQRFLTADNATVTISGNFDRALAFRATRRFFGSWLKADKTTPSTFRQPDEPAVIVMSLPSAKGSAARFAFRGVARSDKDLGASLVFAKVLQKRLSLHAGHEAEVSVRNEYRTLPGSIVISVPASMAAAREAVIKAIADTITDREFAAAKSAAQSEWTMREPTSFWLDADTYRIAKVETDVRLIDDVTLTDVSTYAQRVRNLPLVNIVISAQPNQP